MQNSQKYQYLFSPFEIGGLTIKNRLVMAPMTTNYAQQDGDISSRLIKYYAARAEGGVGMIVIEAAAVEYPRGKGLINELNFSTDAVIESFSKFVKVLKRLGTKVALQLQHAGGYRKLAEPITAPSIAPSTLNYYGYDAPIEMDVGCIKSVVNLFAGAAVRAKKAGFDAIEYHGAHSYLICQFLSPLTNKRTDGYGGSLSNRLRFFQEIIESSRRLVGKDYPIICRLSADEYVEGGITIEDSRKIARGLEEVGASAIHVSISSTPEQSHREIISNVPPMDLPQGPWIHLAEEIKRAISIPVIAVGRIHSPDLAEDILKNKKADLIAVGRPLIADPDWPLKIMKGHSDSVRPCIACNTCISRVFNKLDIACAVNPNAGKEETFSRRRNARKIKRVLILGGGPAGLEAALKTADMGHNVEIWEKNVRLGGQLRLAAVPPGKSDMSRLLDYYINRIEIYNISVKLAMAWRRTDIIEYSPDVIIVATGSRVAIPSNMLTDEENVFTVRQILNGEVKISGRLIVLGGGYAGCEVADFLSVKGNIVMLISRSAYLAKGMEPFQRRLILDRLKRNNVKVYLNTRAKIVGNSNLEIINSSNGERDIIFADAIIIAWQPIANRDLMPDLGTVAKEVYIIGDALRPRNIFHAIFEGYMVGYRINHAS